MKAFLVVVSSLCLCGILLCFWSYATGKIPMPKTKQPSPVATTPQQAETQKTTVEDDPLCSPCVERMAMLLEMVQEWETETAQLGSVPDSQQVEMEPEDECSPCEENLKHLKKAREQWEREGNAQEAVAVSNTGDSP